MTKQFGKNCELEYLRVAKSNLRSIKTYGDKTFSQLNEVDFHFHFGGETNTIATLIQHISGNIISRFTDFLTTDGEKPNRNRDSEFEEHNYTKDQLIEKWETAWELLFNTLDSLSEDDFKNKIVFVRKEPHSVLEAINRQVWHYAFHAGQIVSMAKQIKKGDWKNLSIPKGKSNEFNLSQ